MEDDLTCRVCGASVLEIDVRCGRCGVALTAASATKRIGEVMLGRYEIVDLLGQGGMSIVYRGRDRRSGREVALKVLPPELAAQDALASRFAEEARALSQLSHPNIVQLFDYGPDADCYALAMEYVTGVTWERLIVDRGRIDWRTTARIALDVLDALDYAHEGGVIHRDMKPANVMVKREGGATVMDFGIAKMTTSTRLTATGQTMGTVAYMSPEQVRAAPLDHRTDLYSLAVTMVESLTGAPLFDGASQFEVMSAHLSKPPPSLTALVPDCPPALERAIHHALAKHPDDRPATAGELRAEIAAALPAGRAGPTVAAHAPRATALRIAIAALIFVALAGVAAWLALAR